MYSLLISFICAHCFWATICKTARPMLSDRCPVLPVCLSVCDVGVLWLNSWTDQDETWHVGRPRPRPQCVRWGCSSPSNGAQPTPQFLARVPCGQKARWIKMPLGMEVGLGPGDFVLDGDPSPHPKRSTPPNFRPISTKRPDGSSCHLVRS